MRDRIDGVAVLSLHGLSVVSLVSLPSLVGVFRNLQALLLSFNGLASVDVIAAGLTATPFLDTLDLSFNALSDLSVPALLFRNAGLDSVRRSVLAAASATASAASSAGAAKQTPTMTPAAAAAALEDEELWGCVRVSAFVATPRLRSLLLHDNRVASFRDFPLLSDACSALTRLSLAYNPVALAQLENESPIVAGLGRLRGLVHLLDGWLPARRRSPPSSSSTSSPSAYSSSGLVDEERRWWRAALTQSPYHRSLLRLFPGLRELDGLEVDEAVREASGGTGHTVTPRLVQATALDAVGQPVWPDAFRAARALAVGPALLDMSASTAGAGGGSAGFAAGEDDGSEDAGLGDDARAYGLASAQDAGGLGEFDPAMLAAAAAAGAADGAGEGRDGDGREEDDDDDEEGGDNRSGARRGKAEDGDDDKADKADVDDDEEDDDKDGEGRTRRNRGGEGDDGVGGVGGAGEEREERARGKSRDERGASTPSAGGSRSDASSMDRRADEARRAAREREDAEAFRGADREQRRWLRVDSVSLAHRGLRSLRGPGLESALRLRKLDASHNELVDVSGLERLTRLEELNLEGNAFGGVSASGLLLMDLALGTGSSASASASVGVSGSSSGSQRVSGPPLAALAPLAPTLMRLDLGRNALASFAGLESLTRLVQLSVEDNQLTSFAGLSSLRNLMELYAGNNRVRGPKELLKLKDLPKLIILDLCGNPVCAAPRYRLYTIYHLRRLKVLDGSSIDAAEQAAARERYSGRLTVDFLEERLGGRSFESIRELDLSHCRIRDIETLPPPLFRALVSVNLDHNQLTGHGLVGLRNLPQLAVLHLGHNKIHSLLPAITEDTDEALTPNPAAGGANAGAGRGRGGPSRRGGGAAGARAGTASPVPGTRGSGAVALFFQRLEVLHLEHNAVSDVASLGLAWLPSLKILHLSHNDITRVSGLSVCPSLRELRLNGNRIKQLDDDAFVGLTALRELILAENSIRQLSPLTVLQNLQVLNLASNRVADMGEVEKLAALPYLADLNLVSNPVSRRQLYRPAVLRHLDLLHRLDGKDVSSDEKERVSATFDGDGAPLGMAPGSGPGGLLYAPPAAPFQGFAGPGYGGGGAGVGGSAGMIGGAAIPAGAWGGAAVGAGPPGRVPVRVTSVNFGSVVSYSRFGEPEFTMAGTGVGPTSGAAGGGPPGYSGPAVVQFAMGGMSTAPSGPGVGSGGGLSVGGGGGSVGVGSGGVGASAGSASAARRRAPLIRATGGSAPSSSAGTASSPSPSVGMTPPLASGPGSTASSTSAGSGAAPSGRSSCTCAPQPQAGRGESVRMGGRSEAPHRARLFAASVPPRSRRLVAH